VANTTAVPKVGGRIPWHWGPGRSLEKRQYDCDKDTAPGARRLTRSILVQADAATTWLWLCQLRRAPYSYDWIDNFGRRSPRRANPAATKLHVGDTVMTIFTITSFDPGVSFTLRSRRRPTSGTAVTYLVEPVRDDLTLLHCVMVVPPMSGRIGHLGALAFAWGDLIMMTKQLRTLAALAERDY